MQRQQRDDEIGALGRQRQPLEVADQDGEVARSGAGGGRREAQRRAAAGAGGERRRRVRTRRADVDGDRERALDQDQALGEFVGGATKQEIGAADVAAPRQARSSLAASRARSKICGGAVDTRVLSRVAPAGAKRAQVALTGARFPFP